MIQHSILAQNGSPTKNTDNVEAFSFFHKILWKIKMVAMTTLHIYLNKLGRTIQCSLEERLIVAHFTQPCLLRSRVCEKKTNIIMVCNNITSGRKQADIYVRSYIFMQTK